MTAPFLRTNFAEGRIAKDIGESDTILTVQEGHTLPTTNGAFRLTMYNSIYTQPSKDPKLEIVTASFSGTPNVYNIERAQETTSAYPHTAGDKLAMFYTAGTSRDDLNWLGNFRVDESGAVGNQVLGLVDGMLRYCSAPTLKDLSLSNPEAIYKLGHDRFAGYKPTEHVDHTKVAITGTDGCGGGGSIGSSHSITNTDKGSVARAAHEAAFDHEHFLLAEKDPVFSMSPASKITKKDVATLKSGVASATFKDQDGRTVTVKNGMITGVE